jgi:hypothetical protein
VSAPAGRRCATDLLPSRGRERSPVAPSASAPCNLSPHPPPPAPPQDIDECAEGSSGCPANSNCLNANGTALCHCKDGFAADGAACRDARPPTVAIADSGRPWQRLTSPGAPGGPVDFPAIVVADNVDGLSSCNFRSSGLPRCECTARLSGVSSAQPVYPLGFASAAPTQFPVGTTTVACAAIDAAGNQGPAAAFAVEVRCPANFVLKERSGAWICSGEAALRPGRRRLPGGGALAWRRAPRPRHPRVLRHSLRTPRLATRPAGPPRSLPPPVSDPTPPHPQNTTPPPNPAPCPPDAVKPVLIVAAGVVTGVAPADSNAVAVNSPTLTGTDMVSDPTGASLTLSCAWQLNGQAKAWSAVLAGAGGSTSFRDTFGFGTTLVTCTITDAAGNAGDPVSYTVQVACGAGYSFNVADNKCRGACAGAGRGGVDGRGPPSPLQTGLACPTFPPLATRRCFRLLTSPLAVSQTTTSVSSTPAARATPTPTAPTLAAAMPAAARRGTFPRPATRARVSRSAPCRCAGHRPVSFGWPCPWRPQPLAGA